MTHRSLPAIAVVSTIAATAPSGSGGAAVSGKQEPRCNGHSEYCARRLDQVAFRNAHRSTAARDSHVLFPNQRRTMARQLRDGVRGLQIDTLDVT